MGTTLKDVAAAAGVSVMAACAVLTGGGGNVRVGEAKADRIREKARELGYEPNLMGQSLRTRRTHTIGVVFQHLASFGEEPYYYQQLFDGIMAALFPHGYSLTLSPMLVQSGGKVRIANGRFDGVLWCSPDLIETSVETVAGLRLPVVMVHAPLAAARGVPTFAVDNDLAMGRVVDHLADLGHRRVGFVVKPHVAGSVEGRERAGAFLRAAARRGVEAEVLLWEYEAEELARYVSDDRPHTALAAFNDVHASHLLARAEALGIRVPTDLSVVGFDSSPLSERTRPRLTSVHQPVERIAREAAQCLLRLIHPEPGTELDPARLSTLYDGRIDLRESTAPPPPLSSL